MMKDVEVDMMESAPQTSSSAAGIAISTGIPNNTPLNRPITRAKWKTLSPNKTTDECAAIHSRLGYLQKCVSRLYSQINDNGIFRLTLYICREIMKTEVSDTFSKFGECIVELLRQVPSHNQRKCQTEALKLVNAYIDGDTPFVLCPNDNNDRIMVENVEVVGESNMFLHLSILLCLFSNLITTIYFSSINANIYYFKVDKLQANATATELHLLLMKNIL